MYAEKNVTNAGEAAFQESSLEVDWPAQYIMNVRQELSLKVCSVQTDAHYSFTILLASLLPFHRRQNGESPSHKLPSCQRASKRENLLFVSLFLSPWNDWESLCIPVHLVMECLIPWTCSVSLSLKAICLQAAFSYLRGTGIYFCPWQPANKQDADF